ncbi:MAG: LamG domain-containing protein [Opitutaceae bacterium]
MTKSYYALFNFLLLLVAFSTKATSAPSTTSSNPSAVSEPTQMPAVATIGVMEAGAKSPTTKHENFVQNDQLKPRNYSFGYWLNGFRKNPNDSSPDQLVIETGYYGLVLDLANLDQARFGRITETNDYTSALEIGTRNLDSLPAAELSIELASSGKVFKAKHSVTGPRSDSKRLQDTWLWESGRYLQHFDLHHLVFIDDDGNELSCDARLQVVAWPDSLTLNAEITPTPPSVDGATFGVVGNGHSVVQKPLVLDDVSELSTDTFSLECWVNVPRDPSKTNTGLLLSKNGSQNENGHIGFNIRGNRTNASVNIGGGPRNRHLLREQSHTPFNLDAWNHLALTYDGQTMHYYINGRLESSQSFNQARTPVPGDILLGAGNGENSATYGNFDQIRLWDRALSSNEIKAHAAHPDKLPNPKGLRYEKSFDTESDPKPTEYIWRDVTTRIQLTTTDQAFEQRSPTFESWEVGDSKTLTLNCDLTPEILAKNRSSVTVRTADRQTIQSVFQPELNCQVAEVKKIKRDWKTGYTDIRNYDEFILEIDTVGEGSQEVPFMLYLRNVANITGLLPMLCYEDGTPTGIPVQLSKNWHEKKLGSYLRAYVILPSQSDKQTYKLRIAYGFYGSLPSASHAQLSLVGYAGNSRWDQLAIGCWGETICFDVDRSCVDVGITDVRMLMARIGADGKRWSWTNAGWGGDWLYAKDSNGNRHHPNELKTAYLAHGPCLTDVQYDGNYGSQREISFDAKIQTLRTDDYARTFQKFHYTFNKEVSAESAWLFKMGRTNGYTCPTLAYGNAEGLIASEATALSLQRGDYVVEHQQLTGSAPWWVSFPGASQTKDDGKGNGYRALVIRDYRATFNGKTYTQPTISAPVHQTNKGQSPNVDLLLTAPADVTRFMPGDTIEMDLEWITLHRVADDYYGPNETYRTHLTANPNSWKTTYREAIGNDLKVTVTGGTLINNYPIKIQAEADEIQVQIQGGVGYVPIRFAGLSSPTGYTLYRVINGQATPLDQSVHGNDFWQTDTDSQTNSFSRVYNLPLDGLETSTWVLRSSP